MIVAELCSASDRVSCQDFLLVSVSDYYKQFWNNVVEGCGKLKALDEVKFSDTNIVKIVESSEEKIIYRAGGQRFEKAPRELQIGLAMKIAEKEMDPDAADTRIIRGAVFAIQAVEDPVRGEKAQELWEEAKLIGGDTDNLILFLSDQYDLISSFITKSKLPNEEEATAAEAAADRPLATPLRPPCWRATC